MFAEDTFSSDDPKLAKICEDKSPTKVIRRIKELVVSGSGGRVSGGMKEWGMLGIFELAAVAAMRGQCCPDAPALDLPTVAGCAPFSDTLGAVSAAAKPGSPPRTLDDAIAVFSDDARCVIRSQQEKAFGDYGPLGGGEGTTLDKTIQRIHARGTK